MDLTHIQFDETLFNEMQVLLADDFKPLVTDFMQENFERIESLKQTVSLKDYKASLDFVHNIKGASSNLGLIKVCHLCGLIEEAIRSHSFDILGQLIPQIENEIVTTNLEISSRLEEL